MVKKVKSYTAADLLPFFDRPAMTENVPGVAITLDQNLSAKQIEFQCHSADEYTPVTGFTMKNVR